MQLFKILTKKEKLNIFLYTFSICSSNSSLSVMSNTLASATFAAVFHSCAGGAGPCFSRASVLIWPSSSAFSPRCWPLFFWASPRNPKAFLSDW